MEELAKEFTALDLESTSKAAATTSKSTAIFSGNITDDESAQNEYLDKFKVTAEDLQRLSGECFEMIRQKHLYELRNDAKLRAVNYTQSYDEFKDIVDAAHLQPVSKDDKRNAKTKSRLWNSAAREE